MIAEFAAVAWPWVAIGLLVAAAMTYVNRKNGEKQGFWGAGCLYTNRNAEKEDSVS